MENGRFACSFPYLSDFLEHLADSLDGGENTEAEAHDGDEDDVEHVQDQGGHAHEAKYADERGQPARLLLLALLRGAAAEFAQHAERRDAEQTGEHQDDHGEKDAVHGLEIEKDHGAHLDVERTPRIGKEDRVEVKIEK